MQNASLGTAEPLETGARVHIDLLSALAVGHPATQSFAHELTMLRAIIIGLLQGITELFPISSLGHSVLIPGWLGWNALVKGESAGESPYLAFVVGLHVGTALALLVYYWREWQHVIPAAFRVIGKRKVTDSHEHLAWLLIVATIPAAIMGVVFEHALRTLFAKPFAAALFLTINGIILFFGEWLRRRRISEALARETVPVRASEAEINALAERTQTVRTVDDMTWRTAVAIGVAQVGALFAGISRSGITMVAGLAKGLDHEEAARFSFMLATPIILAAGVYKLPDLMGHLGNGIRGQVLVGSAAAALAAFVSVRFLVRYFATNNLVPFAIYCLAFGAVSMIRFA
jgi:undecaprenyl-diphosphatase